MKNRHLHVVAISLDTTLFTQQYGNALERQEEYAKRLGSYSVIVLNTTKQGVFSPIVQENLHIIPTNALSRWLFAFQALRHIQQLHAKQKIDVITTQDPFITGVIGVLAKILWRIPLNVQLHASDLLSPVWQKHSLQNRILTTVSHSVLAKADSLRYLSSNMLRDLRRQYKHLPDATYKAPIYVDVDYFSKPTSPKKRIKNIVTVGRLAWEKNHTNLIQAFEHARQKYPEISLTIVGGGVLEKALRTQVTKLGLQDRVTITGNTTKEQVRDYLYQADLFVLPSFYEGWGMAVVEAVAAGVPVVMNNTGCAGELIVDGKTGIVFDDVSSSGIANALSKAVKQPQKQYEMAKLAQQTLKNDYTKDLLMSNWLRCLNETAKLKN